MIPLILGLVVAVAQIVLPLILDGNVTKGNVGAAGSAVALGTAAAVAGRRKK